MIAPAIIVVVCALALFAVPAGGQTSEDGIRAALRGEYRRAAEILKPIAEDWRSDDTAAPFVMATGSLTAAPRRRW